MSSQFFLLFAIILNCHFITFKNSSMRRTQVIINILYFAAVFIAHQGRSSPLDIEGILFQLFNGTSKITSTTPRQDVILSPEQGFASSQVFDGLSRSPSMRPPLEIPSPPPLPTLPKESALAIPSLPPLPPIPKPPFPAFTSRPTLPPSKLSSPSPLPPFPPVPSFPSPPNQSLPATTSRSPLPPLPRFPGPSRPNGPIGSLNSNTNVIGPPGASSLPVNRHSSASGVMKTEIKKNVVCKLHKYFRRLKKFICVEFSVVSSNETNTSNGTIIATLHD
ncbi:uncharacterized protein [Lepeophtheirus salmonis]|uniref:uncharacterized protein isoform X1 n=1 Tax=Lepeophtheirus salmonis TaxID=72036 RepID=UPI001AE95736|nr:alpha carbonic anhydrase 8-like isoform X1 [Lepeophtheirus salmonis]